MQHIYVSWLIIYEYYNTAFRNRFTHYSWKYIMVTICVKLFRYHQKIYQSREASRF